MVWRGRFLYSCDLLETWNATPRVLLDAVRTCIFYVVVCAAYLRFLVPAVLCFERTKPQSGNFSPVLFSWFYNSRLAAVQFTE